MFKHPYRVKGKRRHDVSLGFPTWKSGLEKIIQLCLSQEKIGVVIYIFYQYVV